MRRKPAPRPDPAPAAAGPVASDVLASVLDEAASRAADAMVLRRRDDMFEDEEIASTLSRAVTYLRAGAPVHFRGPAGADVSDGGGWLGTAAAVGVGDGRGRRSARLYRAPVGVSQPRATPP